MKQSDVDNLEPRNKRYTLKISKVPGFILKIYPSGVKTYILRYRPEYKSQPVDYKIGKADQISLAKATKKAQGEYNRIFDGIDPQAEKKKQQGEITVSELLARYIVHQEPRKKSIANDKGYINNWISPALGKNKISKLSRKQVKDFVRGHPKPVTAGKCVQVLRKAYNLAIFEWEILPENALNPASQVSFLNGNERDRFLSRDELERLSQVLSEETDPLRWRFAQCVRLLLLTGARLRNIMECRWSWVNWEMGYIQIPKEHHKSGHKIDKPLFINLGKQALEILQDLKSKTNSEWVIAGLEPDKPLNGYRRIWISYKEKADLEDFRLHDLRHTYASYIANAGNTSLIQLGLLLGHKSPESTKRYAHIFNDKAKSINDELALTLNF
tara:strand:- start:8149 stop:9303 length:1155 start_codon:yes stop_codon:yes gene_type:complete